PELPIKSPAEFTVLRVQDVPLVSAVELVTPNAEQQDDVRIYIKHAAFEALQAIARQDVQIEQGGVLVGQVYRNAESGDTARYLVEITDHIFAEGATANITELHYNFEAWQNLRARLKDEHPGKQMVGWYHTHLVKIALAADDLEQTTELFFSDHDRFMHRQFFADAWYVAMVLGPEGNAAFFRWFGDKISCNRQFYII
ncbi:MAG: hypothetical protein JXA10_10405, partial [Anaerolineae bacterium]|nr:hypothetical protein [Anaerolineae bacterium]